MKRVIKGLQLTHIITGDTSLKGVGWPIGNDKDT